MNRTGSNRNGQYFDLETLLTRSMYKVFQSKSTDFGENNNTEKPSSSVNYQRNLTPNHLQEVLPQGNTQLQMRLLAQQIFNKIERKFEKKLQEARTRDSIDTEKRLKSIRSEFEEKYRMRVKQLEKDHQKMKDSLIERERKIEERQKYRWSEKEADAEVRTRTLENRLAEVKASMENFEQLKSEWRRQQEEEQEEIRQEKERIALKIAEMRADKSNVLQSNTEMDFWKRRCDELEKELHEMRQKYQSLLREKFEMKSDLDNFSNIKDELDVVSTKLREEMKNCAILKKRLREMVDYDRVKEENEHLRDEVLRSRNAVLERDLLRKNLSTAQKSSSKKISTKHKKTSRRSSSSESTSSLSEADAEFRDIQKRLMNLGEMATEMDRSVLHLSQHHTCNIDDSFEKAEYDDFCRALTTSSSKIANSTPQKAVRVASPIEEERPRHVNVVRSNSEEFEMQVEPEVNVQKEPVAEVQQQVGEEKKEESELFSGVNPVMAQYMKRMMEKREAKPAEEQAQEFRMEVTAADELELDKAVGSGSDFEW